MNYKVDLIKKLREETGAGVMNIKKALDEACGDENKARDFLKEKGLAKAKKRQDRVTPSGLIHSYLHNGGLVGVLLELNCETDFVARTDEFHELAHNLALQIAALAPENLKDLMSQDFIKDSSLKVNSLIDEVIAKTGENIVLRRFTRYDISDPE